MDVLTGVEGEDLARSFVLVASEPLLSVQLGVDRVTYPFVEAFVGEGLDWTRSFAGKSVGL